jgi:hypothetical protein
MRGGLGGTLPDKQLRALDFLIGDSSGPGFVYPPGGSPHPFVGHLHVERESCERFLRMEFFGQISMLGWESVHSLITYSEKAKNYRMWSFSSSQEEPLSFQGKFEGSSLVLVSDPTEMVWGLQRVRCIFTPLCESMVEYRLDFWTIDGYTPYFQGTYTNASVHAL